MEQYIDLIKAYDNISNKDTLLIYYEDLILEPERTLLRLIDYLDNVFGNTIYRPGFDWVTPPGSRCEHPELDSPDNWMFLNGKLIFHAPEKLVPPRDEMKENLNQFLNNIEFHRNNCLNHYKENSGKALSSQWITSDINFHSQRGDSDTPGQLVYEHFLKDIQNSLIHNADYRETPELYDKYLSRFKGTKNATTI